MNWQYQVNLDHWVIVIYFTTVYHLMATIFVNTYNLEYPYFTLT